MKVGSLMVYVLKRVERDAHRVKLWRRIGYKVAALSQIAGSDWTYHLEKVI